MKSLFIFFFLALINFICYNNHQEKGTKIYMETYLTNDNLTFIIEKDHQKMALSKNWGQPFFYLETSPYQEEITFTLENSFTRNEHEIYQKFEEMLIKIFGRFLLQGYARGMDVDVLNKEIRILSDQLTSNTLTIRYTFDKIEFIFRRKKDHGYHNNRIILDIDGVLVDGYYSYVSDLFHSLCSYEQERKKEPNRSRKL